MTIEFNGQMVTPMVLFPDGSVAEVSDCKLLLVTEQEMEVLQTYVGTDRGINIDALYDLALCVTAVYGDGRVGIEVEVRKRMPSSSATPTTRRRRHDGEETRVGVLGWAAVAQAAGAALGGRPSLSITFDTGVIRRTTRRAFMRETEVVVSDARGARRVYDAVKQATVAVVAYHGTPGPTGRLFSIAGSGFCVHPQGVIVTCRHVIEALGASHPHVIFYHTKIPGNPKLYINMIRAYAWHLRDNFDLATLKIIPPTSTGYKPGYPTLPIAPYGDVHEMMEIATCGFPLGDALQATVGTITSSFSRGIISSIIPRPEGPEHELRGFQLDLRTSEGNSGGPVFSLATGQVFGVLQGGIEADGRPIGLDLAEPIYPLFTDGDVERLADPSSSPT